MLCCVLPCFLLSFLPFAGVGPMPADGRQRNTERENEAHTRSYAKFTTQIGLSQGQCISSYILSYFNMKVLSMLYSSFNDFVTQIVCLNEIVLGVTQNTYFYFLLGNILCNEQKLFYIPMYFNPLQSIDKFHCIFQSALVQEVACGQIGVTPFLVPMLT